MEQSTSDAGVRGAQIKRNKEECASDTEQSTSDAGSKDVQTKLFRPECALGMDM